MPGWAGSTRKERLPEGWTRLRAEVLTRDGHRCQHLRVDTGRKCGAFARDVDHIEPSGSDAPSNLQALCDWHHDKKSGAEGGRASGKVRRAKAEAAKPKHPGLL